MAGARLILASDGLWDHITAKKACKAARKTLLDEAPEMLIRLAESKSKQGLTDDTSVLVVDMLPNDTDDFRDVARRLRSPASVIKRLVLSKKQVPPKLLADYDGVDRTNEKDAAKPVYSKAHTEFVEGVNQSSHTSVDDDDSADLTVVGGSPTTGDAVSYFPAANVSKIIDPNKIEEALSV